jgi:hypothetical protein
MKCISCDTDISPKWRHAIDANVCPFCGQHIVEEHLKNCLVSLAKAMEEMQKYPEQLNDWLLSNHGYIKTDNPDLKTYLTPEAAQEIRKEAKSAEAQEKRHSTVTIKLPGGKTQEVQVEKTQSEEKTNGFFERAEALKTVGKAPKNQGETEAPKSVLQKTSHLRELAQKIKAEAAGGFATHNQQSDQDQMAPINDIEGQDAQMDGEIDYADLIHSSEEISSAMPYSSGGDDDEIPSVVMNMARRAAANKPGDAKARDMERLAEIQNKVADGQKRLGTGGFGRA